MNNLSKEEKTLIKHLRENGRTKLSEISRESGIPKSTLFDMLRRLESNQIISHKTHLNFEKIGYPIRWLILLKTIPTKRDELKKYLSKKKEVNNLHEINSGFDFHFEGIFQNQKEAQDFIDKIEHENKILAKEVHNIIEIIETEKFFTNQDDESKNNL